MREHDGDEPEFYIGWQDRAPQGLARILRGIAIAVLCAAPVSMALLASAQRSLPDGIFEYGSVRDIEGVLVERPVPLLRISAPSTSVTPVLLLSGFGKSGIPEAARGHHGKRVRFRGTLIHRRGVTMAEITEPLSFRVLDDGAPVDGGSSAQGLGEVILTGEVVDTKCFLGVMRPGTGKVHRACAIRCIAGGVPPGLLLADREGGGVVVLLAGQDGMPLHIDPEMAGLPATATGTLEIRDELPVLRVSSIRRKDTPRPF